MENFNKLILVYYISVMHLDYEDIPEYMQKIRDKINISDLNGHSIFIPVLTQDSRVECINPKYITEEDLIKEHVFLLKKLNVELQYNVEELNENKDKDNE